MQALWNKIHLERPPNCTWRTEAYTFDTKNFLASLDKIITEIDNQHILHSEAATLSRLIYRMKCKFRNDKGLKGMEKVNKTLLNYLNLGISNEYKNLRSYVEIDGKLVTLPSRQMVEYVLVRTQGLAKLMERAEQVAKYTANFFKQRIAIGHAWTVAVIAYAVVSRIWTLSRYLIKKCCIWYNTLYRYLEKFKYVGVCWLGKDQELPQDLKTWLDLPWIDEELPRFSNEKVWKDNMFKLLQPQKINVDEELNSNVEDISISEDLFSHTLLTKNTNENNKWSDSKVNSIRNIKESDDIGEQISRDTFKQMLSMDLDKQSDINEYNYKEHIEIYEYEENSTLSRPKRVKRMEGKVVKKSNDNKKRVASSSDNKKNSKEKNITVSDTTDNKLKKPLKLGNIKTREDLHKFLMKDSYKGLDKLQWNIIKKNGMKLMHKVDKCTEQKKQMLLVKKAVQSIGSWIH